jgi:hypothetical protein
LSRDLAHILREFYLTLLISSSILPKILNWIEWRTKTWKKTSLLNSSKSERNIVHLSTLLISERFNRSTIYLQCFIQTFSLSLLEKCLETPEEVLSACQRIGLCLRVLWNTALFNLLCTQEYQTIVINKNAKQFYLYSKFICQLFKINVTV